MEKDPLSLFIQHSQSLLERYFKSFLMVLGAGLLLFGLFLLYIHWQNRQNQNTEEILYQHKKKLIEAEKQAGGDILSFNPGQNFFSHSKKGEFSPQLETLSKEYVDAIKQHIKKPSSRLAVSPMARFLYKYDKKKEAIDLLKLADPYKEKNLAGFLHSFQLGAYLLDDKQYEHAIKSFLFITASEEAKWLWPSAFINLGLSYEEQNQIELAKSAYRKAKNSDSSSAQKAKHYFHLLNLEQKIKAQNVEK